MNFYQFLQRCSVRFPTGKAGKCVLIALFATTSGLSQVAHADSLRESANPLQEASYQAEGQAIVVLGDSISAGYGIQRDEGWVHLLDQTLAQREEPWYTVNASISGETTGGGLARLSGLLEEHAPSIVIIELGGNDGLRGYPISRIRSNLQTMVAEVRAAGAIPIMMAMRIPPNYGPRYASAFDNVFGEVATATETLLVPFFLEDVALEEGMMQDDGIHPTAAAQPQMKAAVWQHLEPILVAEAES